ncbi:hypothetical protein L083_3712 [Actinoplanes sp. N902-109]|nr:hypothetical protein L083_3712 [Actinoplanes sp. N902-109]
MPAVRRHAGPGYRNDWRGRRHLRLPAPGNTARLRHGVPRPSSKRVLTCTLSSRRNCSTTVYSTVSR